MSKILMFILLFSISCSKSSGRHHLNDQKTIKESDSVSEKTLRIGFDCLLGFAVIEDMVLGRCQDDDKPAARAFFRSFSYALWPNATVPYVIHPSLESKRQEIETGLRRWKILTVLNFVERTTESDYIEFTPRSEYSGEGSCAATLGRSGGKQHIWCDYFSDHELAHAIGMPHEHQRPDRDQYLIVSPDASYWYAHIEQDERPVGPFDYHSVTIYPGIERRDGKGSTSSSGLTVFDRRAIDEMYGPLASGRVEEPLVLWTRSIVEKINKDSGCDLFLYNTALLPDKDGRLEIKLGYLLGDAEDQSWYTLSVFEFFDEQTNADIARIPMKLDGVCR